MKPSPFGRLVRHAGKFSMGVHSDDPNMGESEKFQKVYQHLYSGFNLPVPEMPMAITTGQLPALKARTAHVTLTAISLAITFATGSLAQVLRRSGKSRTPSSWSHILNACLSLFSKKPTNGLTTIMSKCVCVCVCVPLPPP